jgi:Big-like domain-containing protein
MSDSTSAPAEVRGLRAPGKTWRDLAEGVMPHVLHLDPPDGACGVFRDTPIVVSFSRPADVRSVSCATFVVRDEDGDVPGGVWTSLDGRVAVWTPARLLVSGGRHVVRLAGLRDSRGRDLAVYESTFVPGLLALGDLGP